MDHTQRPVIASGGVATLDDVAALRDLVPHGLEGAIIGKALYARRLHARRGARRGRRLTDSAGVPWEGRHFEPNAAADDDGTADPKTAGGDPAAPGR